MGKTAGRARFARIGIAVAVLVVLAGIGVALAATVGGLSPAGGSNALVVEEPMGRLLALPQNQPNAPLYPAGGAPGSRPGALPHFGRPRYLGPPPRARSTAG